jgi:hypothetical protein
MQKVNILGTEYTIEIKSKEQDKFLKGFRDGYCDKTSKKIVVRAEDEESELDDYGIYLKSIIRHEIVHAFLFESGLHENFSHPQFGHEETMVDWIAVQFPKMLQAFKEADCI